jgi:hypothetical protein
MDQTLAQTTVAQFVNAGINFMTFLPETRLTSEPGLVEKFIRGTVKTLWYAQTNRLQTIGTLSQVVKIKHDVASRIYDESRPGITQDGTVNEEQQRKSLAPFLGRMVLERSATVKIKGAAPRI